MHLPIIELIDGYLSMFLSERISIYKTEKSTIRKSCNIFPDLTFILILKNSVNILISRVNHNTTILNIILVLKLKNLSSICLCVSICVLYKCPNSEFSTASPTKRQSFALVLKNFEFSRHGIRVLAKTWKTTSKAPLLIHSNVNNYCPFPITPLQHTHTTLFFLRSENHHVLCTILYYHAS